MRILPVVLALAAGVAVAQKSVTYYPPTSVHQVELRRSEDGGVELTVYARAESADGGHAIDRARTCALESLTSAQRSCLATLRDGALACWRSGEGL